MVNDESSEEEQPEEIAVYATKLEGAAILDSGCSRHVCGRQFHDRLTGWHTGPTVSVRVATRHPRAMEMIFDVLVIQDVFGHPAIAEPMDGSIV